MSDEVQPAVTDELAKAADESPAPQQAAQVDKPAGDATDPDDPSGEDAAADSKPKKGGGVQKRIAELTRDREDARRERDHWRALATRDAKPADQAPNGLASGPTKEPVPGDYQDYEEYLMARAEYRVGQRIQQERREAEQARAQEQLQESRKAFDGRMNTARDRYADYDEVVAPVLSDRDFPISEAMAEAIMSSDKGADLAYWLGSHRDEAQKLSRLSPVAAARELGRIEATLQSPQRRTETKAPNPPNVLKGGDTPVQNLAALAKDEDASAYAEARKAGKRA